MKKTTLILIASMLLLAGCVSTSTVTYNKVIKPVDSIRVDKFTARDAATSELFEHVMRDTLEQKGFAIDSKATIIISGIVTHSYLQALDSAVITAKTAEGTKLFEVKYTCDGIGIPTSIEVAQAVASKAVMQLK